jgi:hypothetical protein
MSNSSNSSPTNAFENAGLQNLAHVASNLGDQFLAVGSDTPSSPQQPQISQAIGSPGGNSVTMSSVTFVNGKDAKMLTSKRKITHATIQEVYTSYKTLKFQDNAMTHVRLMDSSVHALLDMLFFDHGEWRTMESKDFFEMLLREYPEARNSSKSTIEERFRNLDKKLFHVDIEDANCFDGLFFAVETIMAVPDGTTMTSSRIEDLCKILTRSIGRSTEANKKLQLHMEAADFKPTQLSDWFRRARKEMERVYQAVLTAREYGAQFERPPDVKGIDKPANKGKGDRLGAKRPRA